MSTTTYIINFPDVDDVDETFPSRQAALDFLTGEVANVEAAAEAALTRAEEYGHDECHLGNRRTYLWTKNRPATRQIR